MIDENWPELLRKIMIERCWTRHQLANALHLGADATLYAWLGGTRLPDRRYQKTITRLIQKKEGESK